MNLKKHNVLFQNTSIEYSLCASVCVCGYVCVFLCVCVCTITKKIDLGIWNLTERFCLKTSLL